MLHTEWRVASLPLHALEVQLPLLLHGLVEEHREPVVGALDEFGVNDMPANPNKAEALECLAECADETTSTVRVRPIRHIDEGY